MKRIMSFFLAAMLLSSLMLGVIPVNAQADEVEMVTVSITDQDGGAVWTGQAPKGDAINNWLDTNAVSHITKDGFTADKWYNADSGVKFGDADTFQGWTNVKVKYEPVAPAEKVTVEVFDEDGKKIWNGEAPKGEEIVSWLDENADAATEKENFTSDKWYNKDSGFKFAETDTFQGWTNVLVKYEDQLGDEPEDEDPVVSPIELIIKDEDKEVIFEGDHTPANGTDSKVDDLIANVWNKSWKDTYGLVKAWSTKQQKDVGETGTVAAGDTVTVILAAKGVTYEMSFVVNGGSMKTETMPMSFGKEIGKLPKPTRSGYVFKGWFWDSDCKNMVDTSANYHLADDCTVYAKWAEEEVVRLHIYTDPTLDDDPIKSYTLDGYSNGDVIDLTEFRVRDYFKPSYTYRVKAFYDDTAKDRIEDGKKADSVDSITVDGRTRIHAVIEKSYVTSDTPPKTGDAANLGLSITIMIASASGLAAMYYLYKKSKKAQA